MQNTGIKGLGGRINLLRRVQNMTVPQLARHADISVATMARRLNESTDFRARELVNIAPALHTSVEELLGEGILQ